MSSARRLRPASTSCTDSRCSQAGRPLDGCALQDLPDREETLEERGVSGSRGRRASSQVQRRFSLITLDDRQVGRPGPGRSRSRCRSQKRCLKNATSTPTMVATRASAYRTTLTCLPIVPGYFSSIVSKDPLERLVQRWARGDDQNRTGVDGFAVSPVPWSLALQSHSACSQLRSVTPELAQFGTTLGTTGMVCAPVVASSA